MDVQVIRLDLNKTKENWPPDAPFKPAHIAKQPTVHPENWFVLDAPIQPGSDISWAFTKNDQYVRIPLFLYTLSSQADVAFAYLLQLGLSCAGNLPGKVKKLRVVTGVPVDLLCEEGINTGIGVQYWFGLAVTTTQGA